MEFTPENVEAAVVEFYKNPGKVNKECHEWLKSCQSSTDAWHVVWPLLDPSKMLQIQFVSANMLHYKVSRCLQEIPEAEYHGLKDRLVAVVAKYISGPNVVLTRLCLTLGAFVTNTIGHVWPNPLDDLASMFSPQNFPGIPEVTVLRLLVQVFGYIPEQAQTQWQTSIRKGQAYRELQEKGQMMYSWLFNVVLTQKDSELVLEGLRGLNSWMKMICIFEWPEIFQLVDVLNSFCESSVISEDGHLSDVTLEILSAIIGDPTAHQYPTMMLKMLDKIIPLQSSLEVVIQREDMELASSFYGMYVAYADCHSKLVVDVCDPEYIHSVNNPRNRENALALIRILLQCTDYPGIYPVDEIVSNITISVWYSLVEDIQAHQSERLKYVRIMQVFEDVYQTLAKILVKKAKYPVDTSDWNSEEMEQFRVYRQDVCDCITYCFELRGWTMLNELVDWSEAHLDAIDSNPEEVIARWPELESLLMAIRAVAENISDETDPVVVSPMSRVFTVVYRILKFNREGKNPKLFQAAIECVSSCSGMLHMYDAVVKNIIGFILEGLFQPEIWTSAALAMKTLSRDCTKNLSEFTPQILSSCKQALECGRLSPNDCNRIVFCIGRFLPFLPPDQIISAVNEIFSPCMSQLQTLAGQEPQQELKTQLTGILNIFSTLCLSLDASASEDDDEDCDDVSETELDPSVVSLNNNNSSQAANNASSQRAQPLIPVVEQILPVLIPVAEKWARDEETIEALFSIVKHTLSTINSSSMTVLQYSMQLVLISFRLNPLPSATSVAKQTLLMLGKENMAVQSQFLGEMHMLCANRLKDTRDTEFTESYLQLIAQLIKSNIELVNASGISLDFMLHLSIESLSVLETSMVKAAIFFTTVAIEKSTVLVPQLSEYFKAHGPTIVQKILLSVGYVVPRSHCQHFAELFLILNKHFSADFRKWLSECLGVEGFPSTHANQEQKSKFFIKVTKEKVNKRAVQDAISEFAVACRNMSGSEYAASTSKRI